MLVNYSELTKKHSADWLEWVTHSEHAWDHCRETGAHPSTIPSLFSISLQFMSVLSPSHTMDRQVGVRLAQGESLADILATSDTTEGVATTLALQQLLMTKIDPRILDFKFPIISGVAAILKGHITPSIGLKLLMQYPVRDENRE